MWYFTWILGLGLALAFGVINAMWYEIELSDDAADAEKERAAGVAAST